MRHRLSIEENQKESEPMDMGYIVIGAMIAAYCLTGVVLYLRARGGAGPDEEKS